MYTVDFDDTRLHFENAPGGKIKLFAMGQTLYLRSENLRKVVYLDKLSGSKSFALLIRHDQGDIEIFMSYKTIFGLFDYLGLEPQLAS